MLRREKKMFVIFTLIYTILIFLNSFFIHTTLEAGAGQTSFIYIGIFFGTSLVLSYFYAWLIISRNKRIFATLKCIGWTNSNVKSLVTGNILYTTFIGFIIVIEILFHYAAIMAYLGAANPILIGLLPVVASFGVFLLVQLIAIFLGNRKVLKLRPMLALKRVGT
jgi:hypothetical protein